ncbi:MAG: 3-dehydroquinate synthase [Clostridia bacterium]|nr:3-dehydroquinate synthase [Clostridia bacterium]
MIIPIKTGAGSYDISIGDGYLSKAKQFFNLDRKVLVVTDTGVPKEYAKKVVKQCKEGYILTIPEGEKSKNTDVLLSICSELLKNSFTRSDAVVAVGGGVIGDMAGFAAAIYMRGIDFYNIPTTLLSQVDSSIGGKVAVDFNDVKNILGAFYPPKGVLIDPEVLKSLPSRQLSNGMAEAIKMALTFDAELFEYIGNSEPFTNLEEIIIGSLMIKKMVVEEDEKESGIRKALNFGHTIGHAIESSEGMTGLYHGECVSLGMLPMCTPEIREKLIPVLRKYSLPVEKEVDIESVTGAVLHDKKTSAGSITVIKCSKVGTFEAEKLSQDSFVQFVKDTYR